MKPITIVLFIIAALSGCSKTDPAPTEETNPVSTRGVYILNEGGFTKSNSSLSWYVPDSNKVYADVFFAANNRPLGDVANDLVIYNEKAFIVVNNSHKVEIISTVTHKSIGMMNLSGNSPNKIVIVNETKGYITNLYKGTVTAFNPTTYEIIKDNIAVGLNPQGLAVANGKVLVCNSGYGSDSTLSVIDPLRDSVIATVKVGKSPTDIAIDSDGDVIVLCNGYSDYSNPANDTPGSIMMIDPATYAVKAAISLPLTKFGHPRELAVSNNGYGFTVVHNGIVKFDTKMDRIISEDFISRTSYSIAVDNVSERIYLGDAGDYTSGGTVFVYEKNAVLIDSASVGVIPGTIVVKN